MASEVYTTEEVTLHDGTDVEIRPLVISKLRQFQRIWSEHMKNMVQEFAKDEENRKSEADMTDEQYDVFIKLCVLCLEEELKGDKTQKAFSAYLENNLEEPTIYKILNVCGGLSLGEQGNQSPAGVNPTVDGLN